MRDLRIVFMGTPEFAVHSLKTIVEAGYHVVGVVTAPDKPAGRGRKLQQSAVKRFAVEQGLKVLQPINLKSEEFISELKNLKPNVQVVVAFRMLPRIVWEIPQFGTFNLHASLLPQYRGAAPINWAIINGENTTGVSTFFIDDKIDTGEMILQEQVPVQENDNAGSLHDTLMEQGAQLILNTLHLIQEDKVKTTPQPQLTQLNTAHKLDKTNTEINWSQNLDQIYNFIRGLSPYPAAWTTLFNDNKEQLFKIYEVEKEKKIHQAKTGTVLQEDKIVKIAVDGGFIILKEVQLPGKRKMSIKDLLNGYKFTPGAKVL